MSARDGDDTHYSSNSCEGSDLEEHESRLYSMVYHNSSSYEEAVVTMSSEADPQPQTLDKPNPEPPKKAARHTPRKNGKSKRPKTASIYFRSLEHSRSNAQYLQSVETRVSRGQTSALASFTFSSAPRPAFRSDERLFREGNTAREESELSRRLFPSRPEAPDRFSHRFSQLPSTPTPHKAPPTKRRRRRRVAGVKPAPPCPKVPAIIAKINAILVRGQQPEQASNEPIVVIDLTDQKGDEEIIELDSDSDSVEVITPPSRPPPPLIALSDEEGADKAPPLPPLHPLLETEHVESSFDFLEGSYVDPEGSLLSKSQVSVFACLMGEGGGGGALLEHGMFLRLGSGGGREQGGDTCSPAQSTNNPAQSKNQQRKQDNTCSPAQSKTRQREQDNTCSPAQSKNIQEQDNTCSPAQSKNIQEQDNTCNPAQSTNNPAQSKNQQKEQDNTCSPAQSTNNPAQSKAQQREQNNTCSPAQSKTRQRKQAESTNNPAQSKNQQRKQNNTNPVQSKSQQREQGDKIEAVVSLLDDSSESVGSEASPDPGNVSFSISSTANTTTLILNVGTTDAPACPEGGGSGGKLKRKRADKPNKPRKKRGKKAREKSRHQLRQFLQNRTGMVSLLYTPVEGDYAIARDQLRPRYPTKWTREMRHYYSDSWGGESFDVQAVQRTMSADQSLWRISWEDRRGPIPVRGPYKRSLCYNCSRYGHPANICPEPLRIRRCHMCGMPGHREPTCPSKICLECGRAAPNFSDGCWDCKHILHPMCTRCIWKHDPAVPCSLPGRGSVPSLLGAGPPPPPRPPVLLRSRFGGRSLGGGNAIPSLLNHHNRRQIRRSRP